MALFRPHRGALDVAMAESSVVNSKQDVIDKVTSEVRKFDDHILIDESTVNIKYYGEDGRINWSAWIVTLQGAGVVGFTNANLT